MPEVWRKREEALEVRECISKTRGFGEKLRDYGDLIMSGLTWEGAEERKDRV